MNDKSFSVPSVAVLLAAFNGIRWLGEQLDSILAQQGVKVTVYISVDLSLDGTEEWVEKRAIGDGRVVILPHGMKFGGASPNFLRLFRDVNLGGYDYVSLADQDDIWLPNKLSRAVSILSERSIDAYSSNVIAFWPDGRRALIKKCHPQVRWDFLFEAAGPGCTYVLTNAFATDFQNLVLGNWDRVQNVGLHDWLIYAFARANNFQWFIDEQANMLYRQHAENQVGVNSGLKAFLHRVRKVTGGWAIGQAALIAEIVGVDKHPFILRWTSNGRIGMLWLAVNGAKCRRRWSERWLFSLSCLIMFVRY
ncbi:glycosyltransferase [Massilia sp. S19_KUP03_FR1]|uniref:glycosyltransferase n=1 Tax=Massilia sp. S19_KUP03_FR1 TaxID=3025503 RepID=UPI002FCD6C55